jgi:transcription initiation factor TFIID subunit 12
MNQPPQAQPGPGQPQGVRVPMYKPEHMQSLEILAEADKEKYERGLRTLWDAVEKNGPETQAHQAAKQKIIEFSRMVFGKVASMRRQQQQQQQAANAGAAGQPGQQINQAQMVAAQRAAMGAQNRPAGVPGNAVNGGASATGQGPQRPQVAQGGPQKVSQELLNHANSMVTHAPPPLSADKEKTQRWLNDMRAKFIRAATLSDASTKRIKHIEALLRDREAKGNPLVGDELKKMQDQLDHDRKTHNEASTFVNSLRKQQEQLRNPPQQTAIGAGQNVGQQPRPQQGPNAGNPMQAATSSVIAAIDAAKNPQQGAANRQHPPGQTATSQGASGAAAAVQTTAPSNPSHPAPAPQPQVKIEPGTHPHPAPVNTALAAASNGRMPPAGTPTHSSARVQTPQTATPTTAAPGAARSLSHQDAVSMANNASNRQVPPNSASTANQPNPTTTPGSGGLMSNAHQGSHPHAHPQQTTTAPQQFKHQIPRVLTEKAQEIPQPVAIGGGVVPGRPTMSGGTGITGGTMSQPVVTKTPAYTFDVEGEHVLSKRKLDELVRQVCGGGPPGADGNYLTPDVEEVCSHYDPCSSTIYFTLISS